MNGEQLISLCAILSFAVIIATACLAIWRRKNLSDVIRIAGAGVFFTVLILVYPYYAADEGPYALWISLFHAMCTMLMNSGPSEIIDALSKYAVPIIEVYKAVVLALHIIAPLFTLGITLSFFSEKFSKMIYRFRSHRHNSYIFSAINERTLCLAENAFADDRRNVIVFVTDSGKDDISPDLLSRIKAVKGLVICDEVVSLAHNLKRQRNYFLLNVDGTVNLNDALSLYRKYSECHTQKIKIWIYTKDELSPIVFDNLYTAFDIQMVNEEKLIARQLISRYPLSSGIRNGRIGILLIGAGNIGLELLRTVLRCSCFGESVATSIDVIDLDAEKAKSCFALSCPGLTQLCDVRFHSQDITSIGFTELLRKLDPTYMIISLGNEKRNMDTAITVRRLYGLSDGFPKIHILTDHKTTDEQLLPLLNVSDWKLSPEKNHYDSRLLCSFDFKPFGSYETVYANMDRRNYRDWLAVAVNASRIGVFSLSERNTPELLCELYNQVNMYKNYSDAFADAVEQKLYMMGLSLNNDGMGDLSLLSEHFNQYEDRLIAQESRRYEIFMRSYGWSEMPLDEVRDGIYQDKLRRCHARISASATKELSKKLGRDFENEDRINCRRLPDILALANALSGIGMSVVPFQERSVTPTTKAEGHGLTL